MKMRYYLLGVLMIASTMLQAQTKKGSSKDKEAKPQETETKMNLVSNPGFEVEDGGVKTLKAPGMLKDFCPEWISPNKANADLYHVESKSTKTSAPANDYGTQAPLDGNSYAGIRAYTKDPKKTRTYIQGKFAKKMTKDKMYCFKFNISLADNSKFAVNNVGFFISDRKISNPNDYSLTYTPQIVEKTNKVLKTTEAWESVCASYIATGNEEYFILGSFGPDDKLKVEKMKKAPGASGTPQNDAYYYIDGLEIIEVEANSQCNCGSPLALEPDLIYSRSSAKNPDAKPAQIIGNKSVWFAFLSNEVSGMFDADISEIAELMKANPQINIELVGHSETDEINEAKINRQYNDMANKRAKMVKDALVQAGVEESRITLSSKDDTAPATDKTTPLARAQNRRVEFIVK